MGNATKYEQKIGNSSVNQLIKIGDQYWDIKSCIILANQYTIARHESYTMKEQASHKQTLPKMSCYHNTKYRKTATT